jgi:hypothetical protein
MSGLAAVGDRDTLTTVGSAIIHLWKRDERSVKFLDVASKRPESATHSFVQSDDLKFAKKKTSMSNEAFTQLWVTENLQSR